MSTQTIRPAVRGDSELPLAPGLTLRFPAPPSTLHAGSSSERQRVGLPGHCEPCAQYGHVVAHPDFGCGDVGCTSGHGNG